MFEGCQGAKLRFLPHFHYNKDWNSNRPIATMAIIRTSYPTSIITRIETFLPPSPLFRFWSSYPTSIITRIETAHILTRIQYRWNTSYPTSIITRIETIASIVDVLSVDASYPTSIITRIETGMMYNFYRISLNFLPHFHYNKDWNRHHRIAVYVHAMLLTPLPL